MNRAPDDACDLVYALVKIRKVLEHESSENAYWTLKFFCDWILHTNLEGSGAKRILDLLDNHIWGWDPARPETIDPDSLVSRVLSFDLFREHLRHFLESHDLPTVWSKDDFAWKQTVLLYGEEVRDTPIALTGKDFGLKRLKKVVVSACHPNEEVVRANPSEWYHGFRWEFTPVSGSPFSLGYTSNLSEVPSNWQLQGARES